MKLIHSLQTVSVLLVLFFFVSSRQVSAQQSTPIPSKNPCHRTKKTTGDGNESCEGYVVPSRMCTKCRMKEWEKGTGKFFNCRAIFDVAAKSCVKQIGKYVRLNPCDKNRAELYQLLKTGNVFHPKWADMLDSIDYFLYSICEQCCDCVPMGAKVNEYKEHKKNNTLMKADRGNCPAHARADVCKVWPNVKAVAKKKKDLPALIAKVKEPICPEIRDWLEDIKTKGGWYNVPAVSISPSIRAFLTQLTDAVPCKNKGWWKKCVQLEVAQRRLGK